MKPQHEIKPEDMDRALFSHLVIMLAQGAAHHLGLMQPPGEETQPPNLEGAQAMIDMLDMLERRTRAQCSDEEKKFITTTISELKMAFVQISHGAHPEPSSIPATQEPEEAPTPAAEPPPIVLGGAPHKKDEDTEPPRFHKTYG